MSERPRDIRAAQGRHLSAEEIDLWLVVARGVTPRPGRKATPVPAKPAEPVTAAAAPVKKPRIYAVPGYTPPVSRPDSAVPPLAPLERRLRQKVVRGTREIDAAFDLHGLRQDEAHRALFQFLMRAQDDGARIVLVVTGKGSMADVALSGREPGVLRRAVPQWLNAPEWRSLVIGFEPAGRGHGGEGALYIRLRRP